MNSTTKAVLLVTVTRVEARAVLNVFTSATGQEIKVSHRKGKTYYDFGQLGGVNVTMVRSLMGTATPGGSMRTLTKAIDAINPSAIIMVGIAFGTNPDKQKIGDILVSQAIMAYDHVKEDVDTIPRGVRVNATPSLIDLFQDGELRNLGEEQKVHFGLILSGEKLINNLGFRNKLLTLEPEAIGGEMEGTGLYVVASDEKIDWIIAKAICDWADGNKDDKAQVLAARNAARFVLHVIQLGGLAPPSKKKKNKIVPGEKLNYWETIDDPFFQAFEKEIAMDKTNNYLHKKPEVEMQQGKINYLSILYLSQEIKEVEQLSNDVYDIHSEIQERYLSQGLKAHINEKITSIKEHKRLTANLVAAALKSDPGNYLGRSLDGLLQQVGNTVIQVDVALMGKNNDQVSTVVHKLGQQLSSLSGCMEDIYDSFQKLLSEK